MDYTMAFLATILLAAVLIDQSLTIPINKNTAVQRAIPVAGSDVLVRDLQPVLLERILRVSVYPSQNNEDLVERNRRDIDDMGGNKENEEVMDAEPSQYYYRPLYRVSQLTRSHDRYYDDDEDWENAGYLRAGSDVGYMDSYDNFPTVA